MVNRSKDKGTAWESALVIYLRDHGFPQAERRALSGSLDKGDIANVPAVIEGKNCARDGLPGWVDEAEVEKHNAGEKYGVVWSKRRGHTSPGKGLVTMTGEQWTEIMKVLEAHS